MDLQHEHKPLYIIESQNRCESLGMDRNTIPQPHYINDQQLNQTLFEYRKLFDVFDFFANQLFQMVEGWGLYFVGPER